VIGGAIGLAQAILYLQSLGFDHIHEHTKVLHAYTLKRLKEVEGVTVYNETADNPVIAFNIEDIHPHDVATMLDQYHVSVRAGHHCAQLVSKFLGVVSTLRVSFHVYNSKEDCDAFIDAVKAAQTFFTSF